MLEFEEPTNLSESDLVCSIDPSRTTQDPLVEAEYLGALLEGLLDISGDDLEGSGGLVA